MTKNKKIILTILSNLLIVPLCLYGALRCYEWDFKILCIALSCIPLISIGFPILVGNKIFTAKEFFSIILMMFACFISLQTFNSQNKVRFHYEIEEFSIKPNFLSLVFAVLLYISFFVKGTLNFPKKIYSYVIIIFNLIFLSSFMSIFISNDQWELFGLIELPFSAQTLAIIAILISYFGIKAAAGFAWIALFICGFSRLVQIDSAMGRSTIPYVLCPFVSLLMQVTDSENFKQMLLKYSNSGKKALNQVGTDINSSVEVTKKAVKTVAEAVSTATTGMPVNAVEEKHDKS